MAARLQCHHAVQLNTRVARGLVPARDDDSHTSLAWNAPAQALVGEPFTAAGKRMRLGVAIGDAALLMLLEQGGEIDRFPLHGMTIAQGAQWIESFGVDPGILARPIHFDLEDHALLHGERFEFRGHESDFRQLARDYDDAAHLLEAFRGVHGGSAVRCWPHHFDIGTLITRDGGSIGIGLSPGDHSYAEPYYYVTPWPYPPAATLPKLDSRGGWHTEGWTGAVLPSHQFAAETDRAPVIHQFMNAAFAALT